VFTLRRGLRYSDGTPVRPGDFRASMERSLGAPSSREISYFNGIVGARRCIGEGTRCDLSRGIESDAHARTITVHLTAPDPEFLHKLTLPWAYVVPPGTPAHADDPAFAPPGTGPYRVVRWDVRRGGVLVRSPHFRPTAARPAGFPDRMELEVTPLGRVETHTAAVERGTSDLTWLVDYPVRGVLPGLLARAPRQVVSVPWAGGNWMFLNVRQPPFDDIRVRQALNFAVDRAKLVELYGGPQAADLSCQIVSPGFPGYSPYCPYTADRSRGGGWTAPDLERARRLVAASGRAGARVTVHVGVEERRRAGPYFVSLLHDLGFRARLHVFPVLTDYFAEVQRRDSRLQMGWYGWGPDYMSASTMLEPTFGCTARGEPGPHNASRVCDARLGAAIDRARAAPAADAAAAWAAVDRRIVDLAAAVPAAYARFIMFVSKRAGNVTFHPMYQILLDQIWVR